MSIADWWPRVRRILTLGILLSGYLFAPRTAPAAAPAYEFGFAKVDITPTQPQRLSGYGNRAAPFTGIDEHLWVRAMAIRRTGQDLSVLVSVESLGLPGALTKGIAARLEQKWGVPRSRFAVCFTHTHTAPFIEGAASNLFATPQTAAEDAVTHAYTQFVANQVVKAAGQAIDDLAPGALYFAQGKVSFAQNRRVLKDGKWVGFGVNPDGPVDHSLPVLKVVDGHGHVRGIVYDYACHCTTFGSAHNRVNGDWAGYASKYLEQAFDGAVALCTIGCGADMNPPRDRLHALEFARKEGHEIADEVKRLFNRKMQAITAELTSSFGYAGLPVDRPSLDDLKKRLRSDRPQERRHAETMLAVQERMGRLPETYPAPIQVWRFDDQLVMVFLGGEVVVDYALRIKKEMQGVNTWVAAYANDLFGYVASERVRREGGYEVDSSMIYYNQPGPWMRGTEEVLMRRLHELLDTQRKEGPYAPRQALKLFHLADGYAIELVAAEPLVKDPINLAFGPDGRLWVVEMGDYPLGEDGHGKPGGHIRCLTDTDGDGRYDASTLFLDGLSYPTGVWPWRHGVLVSDAPDIFYAEDTDGDGKADRREALYRGFELANPQHRINGFNYGLDNWLYLADRKSVV